MTVDFATQAKQEKDAFVSFKETYSAENTPPANPAATLIKSLSWEFWTSLLVGLAAMVLAGMRTYGKFYDMSSAAFGPGNMATAEAMISIVAIEGVLFVAEAIRASMDISDVGNKNFLKTLKRIGVLTLLISMSAGTGQAIPSLGTSIPSEVRVFVDWAMLIGLGAGSSYVAKVAGGIVGHQVSAAKASMLEITKTYKRTYASWETALKNAWQHSDERVIARESVKIALSTSRNNVRGSRSVPSVLRTNAQPGGATGDVKSKINEYLRTHITLTFTPGPSEVARELGVAKSYASGVIKDFVVSDEYRLIKEQLNAAQ